MRKFDGLNIELTRGDTLNFRVIFRDRELPDTATAVFTVKSKPADAEPALIEKRGPVTGNRFTVYLASEDTERAKPKLYYWDIRVLIPLEDGTYEVITPMSYAAFMLTEVVGDV